MPEKSKYPLKEWYSLEEVMHDFDALCAAVADDGYIGISGDLIGSNLVLRSCDLGDTNGAHEIDGDLARYFWYSLAASVLLHDARFVILVKEGAVLLCRNGVRHDYFTWVDRCLASIRGPDEYA